MVPTLDDFRETYFVHCHPSVDKNRYSKYATSLRLSPIYLQSCLLPNTMFLK